MMRSVALTFCVASLALSHAAGAKPRIGLTEITGDATGAVRNAIADALAGGELVLIGDLAVDRAMTKLGAATELTGRNLRRLANALAADAIISGRLATTGRTQKLTLRVFVSKKATTGLTVFFKNARSEIFRAALRDKLLATIGIEPDHDDRDDDDDDAVRAEDDDDGAEPARKAAAEPGDERVPARGAPGGPEQARRRRADRRVAEADRADDDGDAATALDANPLPAPRPAAPRAARIAAGPSILQRRFMFAARNIPNKPRDVTLSPAAGAFVNGEIYPLALFGSRGIAAGLGLGVEYEQQAATQVPVANTMNTIPLTQFHYSVGVRIRLALGSSETSPELTLRAGYGMRYAAADPRQLTDRGALAAAARDTPPIIYTLFDPGAALRVPVTSRLAVTLIARAMVITDAGPIGTGRLYGASHVFGAAGSAAIDIGLGRAFELQIAGEFSQIGFSFLGGGALATQLDGNPATKDVGGLTDRTFGGWATLAVAF